MEDKGVSQPVAEPQRIKKEWCIWKAFEEACPAAVVIIADFLVVVCLWLCFAGFDLLIGLMAHFRWAEESTVEMAKQIHKFGTLFSFVGITALGLNRLLSPKGE
jgi:hypothetical protein